YDASMDEGWTRWVFDTWKVPYVSLVDSVVRAGRLKQKFDVIILPDQSPRELLEGLATRIYPAPYAGGLGDDGAQALRQFVDDGGTLVALNNASRFAIQTLLLPVRNVLEGLSDDDFYAPGSIFRIELDTTHAVTKRMPSQSIAWFESGPAFDVLDSSLVRIIARYPDDPDQLLLSGWVLHPDRVAGRAATADAHSGRPAAREAHGPGPPLHAARAAGVHDAAHGQGAVRERVGVRIQQAVAAGASRRLHGDQRPRRRREG